NAEKPSAAVPITAMSKRSLPYCRACSAPIAKMTAPSANSSTAMRSNICRWQSSSVTPSGSTDFAVSVGAAAGDGTAGIGAGGVRWFQSTPPARSLLGLFGPLGSAGAGGLRLACATLVAALLARTLLGGAALGQQLADHGL